MINTVINGQTISIARLNKGKVLHVHYYNSPSYEDATDVFEEVVRKDGRRD